MAGQLTGATKDLVSAWLIGAGGPLESGTVDVVLSSRALPILDTDVYNAADLVTATGVVPSADAVTDGPYVNAEGKEVISVGSHFFESGPPTPPAAYVPGVARQVWVISQDVAPVLLAAAPVREDSGGLNFNAVGVGGWVDVEIEV